MELYNRIKRRREELGLSQEELARKMGYKSRSSINKIEMGTNDIPQSKISAFAKALDVSEAWLMGFNVPMTPNSNIGYSQSISIDTIAFEITGRSLQYSPLIFDAICQQFEQIMGTDTQTTFSNGALSIHNIHDLLRHPDISFDTKASALNAIIDMVFYNTKKRQLDIYFSCSKDDKQKIQNQLTFMLCKLNSAGIEKVLDYATDLSSVPTYSNTNQSNSSTDNLLLNAAHEDEISTPEERRAGDAIMIDDAEWE